MMNILLWLKGNTKLRKLYIAVGNTSDCSPSPTCYCKQCENLGQDQIEAFGSAVSNVYWLTNVNAHLELTANDLLKGVACPPLMWDTLNTAGQNPFVEENIAQDVVLVLSEVSLDPNAMYSYLGRKCLILEICLTFSCSGNHCTLGIQIKAAQKD